MCRIEEQNKSIKLTKNKIKIKVPRKKTNVVIPSITNSIKNKQAKTN